MTFDPEAATRAHIDSLGPEALAKAQAYTTGNHWLLLWGLVVTGVVTWMIVRWGILDRVAGRCSRRGPNLRAFLVAATFFLVSALITLPWTLYEDWWRERAYGRTSQPLGDFLAQGAIGLALSVLLGALFMMGVYALLRRTGRRWWLWSAGLTALATSALLLAAPILIEPLFNDYQPVPPGEVRDALVVMAQQAGVPTDRIFVYDGSRQSNNFTANVAGLAGTARIAISDVAFKGASLDEVRAVTGHEIGHYVLGHVWRMVIVFTALALVFFWLADRLYLRFARAFGSRAALSDPTSLPVLLFVASLFGLLAQPAFNTLIRVGENEADRYSLETVNLPDALASALVKTAEYRYPRPGALEEFVFYSHPSVERRVRRAMEWKAAHGGR
ncbi:MAG: M48 family metallopeptidase [Acidobacteria bacterium]|jgi:STE24 endopeptidase|nr:M48 family metallopeptidase [Acidobacteriota bacterium]